MSNKNTKYSGEDSNLDNLTNNLNYLMQIKKIDAAELSKVTGVALTTVNGLRKGGGNPTLSTLQAIADFFQISIGQLTESNISNHSILSRLIEIPLLEVQELQEFLINGHKFNKTISLEFEKHNHQYFAVIMTNNSMLPLFEKGTIFVVSHELLPQDGDIVLVQFYNHTPCFRKIFIEDETYIFGPVSEIVGCEISKSKNFIIHGVVTKAIQNFHE